MSSDEVRDVIAGLREGDEVEIVYTGTVEDRYDNGKGWRIRIGTAPLERFYLPDYPARSNAVIRVIKRAPLPLTCAICGKPVERWLAPAVDVVRHLIPDLTHEATLTLPEPPRGTPVWWGDGWWRKPRGVTSPYYGCLTADRDSRLWADMPGAVPAATPEPLICAVCGTEMTRYDIGCLHLADNDDEGHIGIAATPGGDDE